MAWNTVATSVKRSGSNDPYYYTEDSGCKYSLGRGCLECPYQQCLETMNHSQWKFFIADWKRDKAVSWRQDGVGCEV